MLLKVMNNRSVALSIRNIAAYYAFKVGVCLLSGRREMGRSSKQWNTCVQNEVDFLSYCMDYK